MSKLERVLRIALAIVVFSLGVYFSTWWGLLGLIPLLTGIFAVCPIRVFSGKQACPLGVCPISKKKS
ncbi:DUF2892 domain-containing protein [Campylobacter lari]|uniref:Inner membrane protein YgaP-like transmembrane domain-containing protein n=1 Tax=Campylobacter lari TaxID=201 RepID=M5B4M5_CAMLA|nr:DUF2892 domain-containing protein [Campylobacter lari]MBT0828111.1 DUF2892 domain-containing protein [Campylobacter lari]BAN13326.1 hypothetical protein [Campylobacter lari]